jgi:hypothetical protein
MLFRRRSKGLEESEKALREADQNLEEVKSRDEEVHEVAESLKVLRERNHFAEQLQLIFENSGAPAGGYLGGGH